MAEKKTALITGAYGGLGTCFVDIHAGKGGDLLNYYHISVEEALRKAGLPGDVFRHKTPAMKEEDYYKDQWSLK